MDWRWAAACVQLAGRGHIVSPRAQLAITIITAYFFPKITPGRAGSPEEPVATGGAIFLHAGYRSCHSTVPQC